MGNYDVVIIGGGPAGLSAALILARSRRSVLLLDAGTPRNASAVALHGFLTRDGTSVEEVRRIAHEQLQQYPLFELRRTQAQRIKGTKGDFEVQLTDGAVASCRRVLVCAGLKDELPPLPGLQEVWGKAAFECPYCDGWEVRDKVLGYLESGGDTLGFSSLLQTWASRVVVFTDERVLPPGVEELLAKRSIVLERRKLSRVVRGADGWLDGLEMADGSVVSCQALFLRPRQLHTAIVRSLQLELDSDGMVRVNGDMETGVDGISAAGDVSSHSHGALTAAASGSTAGHALHRSLVL